MVLGKKSEIETRSGLSRYLKEKVYNVLRKNFKLEFAELNDTGLLTANGLEGTVSREGKG